MSKKNSTFVTVDAAIFTIKMLDILQEGAFRARLSTALRVRIKKKKRKARR